MSTAEAGRVQDGCALVRTPGDYERRRAKARRWKVAIVRSLDRVALARMLRSRRPMSWTHRRYRVRPAHSVARQPDISEAVFQYILAAVHLLASHAWKLLALYEFDPASGLWRHRNGRPTPSLADAAVPRVTCEPEHALARHLDKARQIVRAIEAARPPASMPEPVVSPEFERFRWFAMPGEAHARLHANPPDIRVVET